MTGGLQEQVTDGEHWFGIGIEPSAKALIGSQSVPYIYEDRISEEQFLEAMRAFYSMPVEERARLGMLGMKHVRDNYNYDDFQKNWLNLIEDITERFGSWDTRKGYNAWELKEVV